SGRGHRRVAREGTEILGPLAERYAIGGRGVGGGVARHEQAAARHGLVPVALPAGNYPAVPGRPVVGARLYQSERGAAVQLRGDVSLGAVLMGAMTYIGNGPNFMVKAIAEKSGIAMPSFFGYLAYSCGVLLPLFVLVTFLFM